MPPHPLVKHYLALARNESSPSAMVRSSLAQIGRILIYEATRDFLPTVDTVVQSPMGEAEGTVVDISKPVKVS